MCVGDWRLGSLVRSVTVANSILTTASISIPANSSRVAITFVINGTAVTNNGSLFVDGVQIGTIAPPAASLRHFTMLEHGDLPTKGWSFTNIGPGTVILTVVEYFLPKSIITAGLEEFKRQ